MRCGRLSKLGKHFSSLLWEKFLKSRRHNIYTYYHAYHNAKEDDFSPCPKKNSAYSEEERKSHNELALKGMIYPLQCHAMMKMREIAFHRIFSGTNTIQYDIKCINKVNAEYYWCGGHFTTRHKGKCSYEETKKHCTCITHNACAPDIKSPKNKECWYKNSQKGQYKNRIITCYPSIFDREFEGEQG